MTKKILVVEDNTDLSELLKINLQDLSFDVICEVDGKGGLKRALNENFDLVILDIMLPGMDGIEILKNIRLKRQTLPVLMLTSRSSEMDRVIGLELGADDYVTKPFSIRELTARVKAIFRRVDAMGSAGNPENRSIRIGDLVIYPDRHTVELGGSKVDLTAKEFELLYHFASNPGRAYSRARLLDELWGYSHSGYEHTVNSHINRLRAKIEINPLKPRYILTVWGVGYKFTDEYEKA